MGIEHGIRDTWRAIWPGIKGTVWPLLPAEIRYKGKNYKRADAEKNADSALWYFSVLAENGAGAVYAALKKAFPFLPLDADGVELDAAAPDFMDLDGDEHAPDGILDVDASEYECDACQRGR